jgi:hypothetical protein
MAPTTAPQTAPQTAAQTAPKQPQDSTLNPHLLKPHLSSLHSMTSLGCDRSAQSFTVGLHRAIYHTCARVPADLAHAPDAGGEVGGGSGEGFHGVLHKETQPKHSQIRSKSGPKLGQNRWKSIEIRPGGSLVMIASQRPHCTAARTRREVCLVDGLARAYREPLKVSKPDCSCRRPEVE